MSGERSLLKGVGGGWLGMVMVSPLGRLLPAHTRLVWGRQIDNASP